MVERTSVADMQVMIVGGKAHAQLTLRTALAVAGIKNVEVLSDSKAAIDLLCVERFDALYVDEHARPFHGKPFYRAARTTVGLVDPMVPIFMICTGPKRRFVEALRDNGVTDVMTRPTAASTILRKLRLALELPRAFIKVGDFFGPDRRAGPRPGYIGDERRAPAPPTAPVIETDNSGRDDDRDTILI